MKRIRTIILLLAVAAFAVSCSAPDSGQQAAGGGMPDTRPAAAEARWEKVSDETENVIGVSTDGTKYLIRSRGDLEYAWRILDAASGERKELALDPAGEFDAVIPVQMYMRKQQFSKLDDEGREKFIEAHGGAEKMVLETGMIARRTVGAGGSYLLVDGDLGVLRIDTRTGETLVLGNGYADIAADGTVLLYTGSERTFFRLRPEEHLPERLASPAPAGLVSAVRLLEDGSVWTAEYTMDSSGGDALINVSCVLYGPEGQEKRRVSLGKSNYGGQPGSILYSEVAGVGIAYTQSLPKTLWIFGTEDETARVLVPEQLLPPVLKAVSRDTVMDDTARRTDEPRTMVPFGLISDQRKMLMLDESGTVAVIDLETLKGEIVMGSALTLSLLQEKIAPEFRPGPYTLTRMYWNGENLLCPYSEAPGYVLRLPL